MFDSSAKTSMLGYFYQPFYALYLLMSKDISECDNAQIYIENLDDIDFQVGNNHLTLYQNKHHINKQGSISDRSEDLWKTLRIWSERVNNKEIVLENTTFILTTTVTANPNSIASKLGFDKNSRNPKEALEELIKIAEDGIDAKNKRLANKDIKKHANEDCYVTFANLDLQLKNKLINNIYILDDQSEIQAIQDNIKQHLRYSVKRDQINYFFEKLIGWWFNQVIKNISERTQPPITYHELNEKILEISDEFKKDSLPIDYEFDFNNITAEHLTPEQKNFIEQLNLILINDAGIANAILDYYRAYMQRSKWIKEGSLFINDLNEYEQRLIREWEQVKAKLENIKDVNTEDEKVAFGKELYFQIGEIRLPICSSGTHSNKGFYVMRGSYHILSNSLRIGWHPEYNERLNSTKENYGEPKMEVEKQ